MNENNLNDNQKRLLEQNIKMNPTRVELELTEQCNLYCKFCYNSQKPIISGMANKIIDRLVDEGVLEIILTGGEPMIHPRFNEILIKCCKVFQKVMVQTNGTYITKEHANLFKDNGVFGVNISLHGLEEIHESLTGVKGSFRLAIDGMKNIIARDIRLASNFVLTNENVDSLGSTIDYLYDIGLRELTLTRFTPTGIGTEHSDLAITKEKLNEAIRIAKNKINEYKQLSIILANSIPDCALDSDLKSFCDYCHFGISRFYIDVNGDVLMCGMSRVRIGNILKRSFEDMKKNSEIYKNHVCGLDVPDGCKNCNKFSICRGGCRAAAFAMTNNFNAADPYSIYNKKGMM